MRIHLPLVFVCIFYSVIVLYWIRYIILLRKKLSPLLVSLIANSNYDLQQQGLITPFSFELTSNFYFNKSNGKVYTK